MIVISFSFNNVASYPFNCSHSCQFFQVLLYRYFFSGATLSQFHLSLPPTSCATKKLIGCGVWWRFRLDGPDCGSQFWLLLSKAPRRAPAGQARGVSSLWAGGNGGGASHVCLILILAAVFLSHTVSPTSCFHCPSLLPREGGRKEEQRDPPHVPLLYTPVQVHSLVSFWGV